MLTIICIVVTLLVKGVGDNYTFLHVMQVNALLYDKIRGYSLTISKSNDSEYLVYRQRDDTCSIHRVHRNSLYLYACVY